MTEEGPPEVVTRRMEAALGSLANETRLRIIQTMLADGREPMTFSELRDAVGVEDSGQFSYHLGKLTGRFLHRTDDGYELRYSGLALYHALLAGIPFGEEEPRTMAVDGHCPDCGADLALEFDRDVLTIACPECGAAVHNLPYPVGGVEGRSDEAVRRAFDRRTRSVIYQAVGGVCPWCAGPMTSTLLLEEEDCEGHPPGHMVKHACERCDGDLVSTVGEVLLTHPAVVSFFHDHGVDVGAVPTWELDFCVSDRAVTVESTDPVRVRVTVEEDGDVLELVLDEHLSVLESAAPAA